MELALPIQAIHSFLVHPLKGGEDHVAVGTAVSHEGRLFDMLAKLYDRAAEEGSVEICFRADEAGEQNNVARDMLSAYMRRPIIENARRIAGKLETATDGRSGLGLLFLIKGVKSGNHKLFIARFPTDEGISADESAAGLTVQYLDQIFLKNKFSFKAVVFETRSTAAGLQTGRAIDRQNSSTKTTFSSDYWISDFLEAGPSLTPAAGTRRYAIALRKAIDKAVSPIKGELFAAATLSAGLTNRSVSIASIGDQLALSDQAIQAIRDELRTASAASERFRFDREEFVAQAGFMTVELNTEVVITAPANRFNQVVTRTAIGDAVEFRARGQVVDQRLRKQR